MSSRSRTSPLVAALVALLAVATAVGAAVWVMTMPWFTALAVPGQADSAAAGLTIDRMVELAEEVRVFVTDADAPALPENVDGRPAFDEDAVSHLVDVRNVVIAGRWATLVSAGLLLVAALWAGSVGHGDDVAAGSKWGGLALVGGVGLLSLMGLLDFDGLFTAFHGVFFEAGTWRFPTDALLILIFPAGFWILAATITGVVISGFAVVLLYAGRSTLVRA